MRGVVTKELKLVSRTFDPGGWRACETGGDQLIVIRVRGILGIVPNGVVSSAVPTYSQQQQCQQQQNNNNNYYYITTLTIRV